MSGHSKWHSIRHKKGAVDAKRGKLFSKLSRAITVAAREGGGNPESNHTLAAAVDKAKQYNMPHDKIDRAIKRGTGEIEGATYEEVFYEGYGPGGVAVMVHVLTDNRNRAAAEMRNIFTRADGNLGSTGSVSWMFEKKGLIMVERAQAPDEEELLLVAIEAGADDMKPEGDTYEITCEPSDLMKVKQGLEEAGVQISSAQLTMIPTSTQRLDEKTAKKILRLMDALEESDDVQEVYSNFDIPDEIMERLAG